MPRIAQSGEKGCRKKTSNKWFETQDNIAYYEDFGKEKIVWNRISSELCFCYDNQKIFIADSMFMITCNSNFKTKYLIGVLNSSLSKHWIKQNAATLGANGYEMSKIFVEKIPIPKITAKNKKTADEIANLVDTILEAKNLCHTELSQESEVSQSTKEIFCSAQDDNKDISVSAKPQYDTKIKDLQSQIDSLVYALYGLDSHEIDIIKNS